MIKEDNCMR